VYHIENYLLEERFIVKVINDNPTYATRMAENEVTEALTNCAKSALGSLVMHRMRTRIYAVYRHCLDLGFDPTIQDPAIGFDGVVTRITDRIVDKREKELSSERLVAMREELQTILNKSLHNGSWRSEFRGRDVLRLFAGQYLKGLPYEAFRDAIVARMGDAGYRPNGMAAVIKQIMCD
jgi:hypothetical protein